MNSSGTEIRKQVADQIQHVIDVLNLGKEQGKRRIEMDPGLLRTIAAQPVPVIEEKPFVAPRPEEHTPAPVTVPKKEVVMNKKKASVPVAKPVGLGVRADEALPDNLEELAKMVSTCTRCPLHQWRHCTVSGEGSDHPDLMFIGEGPGKDEDAQGRPFVGRAGSVLTRLVTKMGYSRETIFIGNIVKCRPTVNNEGRRDRPPTPEEMNGCLPYLKKQIHLLQPKVLVLLGNTALLGLFGYKGITKHRGKWLEYEGIPTMPTFHPSFLLRNGGSGSKPFWDVWEDMSAVLEKLGREVPAVGKTDK